MKQRGPIISIVGIILVGISLFIAMSVVPSTAVDSTAFSVPSLFEGMFKTRR